MNSFFTWQTLMTYSGATAATALITQFFKEISGEKRLPARLISYLSALFILLAATIATDGLIIEELAMAPINAIVVSFASNGAFDALASDAPAS